MYLRDLIGRSVISMATAQQLGTVQDALVSPNGQQILGVTVHGKDGGDYVVGNKNIAGVGEAVVTVDTPSSLTPIGQAGQLASLATLSSVKGSQLVTTSGNELGAINGIAFDPKTLQITAYEFGGGPLSGLFGTRNNVPGKDVVAIGRGLVTVNEHHDQHGNAA